MSRARHKMMSGGTPKPYNAQSSEVLKEAEEKAAGGAVKRARGGKAGMMGEGAKMQRRMDRPGRKRGGGVGSDKMPLSTAARTTDADGHRTGESGEAGGPDSEDD